MNVIKIRRAYIKTSWQLVGGYLYEWFIAWFLYLKGMKPFSFHSYMYANPYSSYPMCRRWWWRQQWRWEDCKMQKISSKDLPGPTHPTPHFYLQVISCGNQRISLGFVSSDESVLMWNADFFCIRALPTTNDSWSNQESLDPLSYRCVCIG